VGVRSVAGCGVCTRYFSLWGRCRWTGVLFIIVSVMVSRSLKGQGAQLFVRAVSPVCGRSALVTSLVWFWRRRRAFRFYRVVLSKEHRVALVRPGGGQVR
jgi:hypothetical protein